MILLNTFFLLFTFAPSVCFIGHAVVVTNKCKYIIEGKIDYY